MAELSEYEQSRLIKIEENRRMLCQLGLLSENKFNGEKLTDLINGCNGSYANSTRNSISSPEGNMLKKSNIYGKIEGVRVGDSWETRLGCSQAGVHRPPVAGIHPGPAGAYSVAISGGYADNEDAGYSFTYTGSGGRDLKGTKFNPKNLRTGPQVRDQTLDGPNGSLADSISTRNPVRVIRGYKSPSIYAPEAGYRYDGLYQVNKYWTTTGLSGHLVYKFALTRCPNQDPPPWDLDGANEPKSTLPLEMLLPPVESVQDENVQFTTFGKKFRNSGNSRLDGSCAGETRVTKRLPNGESHGSENISIASNRHVNNNNNEQGDKGVILEKTCFMKLKNSPVKVEMNGSLAVENRSSACPLPTDICKSPKRNRSGVMSSRSPSVSPAKMVASNQKGSLMPGSYNRHDSYVSKSKVSPSEHFSDLLQKALSDCKNDLMNLSYTVPVIPLNEMVPDNLEVQNNFHTSSGIFDHTYSSFSKMDAEPVNHSNGCVVPRKRSPSPDDFGKICDELCNDLPKIEKVKRLRFSFDHFAYSRYNELPMQLIRPRRKRTRKPRKSTSVNKAESPVEIERSGDGDLIFSKYVDMWLSHMRTTEFDDWMGWDDCDTFSGWSDKELTEARKYSSKFSDFMFNTNSEENSWAGWQDDVSRRSLILNGFLLEEISRSNPTLSEEPVSSEFDGLKIVVMNDTTDD